MRLMLSEILSNPKVTDGQIFKAVNDIVAQEKQREEKFAEGGSVDQLKGSSSKTHQSNVNAVDVPMSAAAKMSLENKKKRENTLQLEVQALKAESDAQRKLITDLIKDNNKNFAEIKSVLSDNRGNGHNSFGAGSSAGFNAGPDQNQN